MRTFYAFKIREEYAILTKNNPYSLFRMLEFIYHLDRNELTTGMDLFYKMVDKLNTQNLENQLLKHYQENYGYTKFKNMHQFHDYYEKEASKLLIKDHYLLLESSILKPTFLQDLKNISRLFLCDFENKDYFWLDTLSI